ncbi:hypothetical protein INT45_005466 [Circinella minor]|uniref:Uncharacterized protein n=1 Tax=Circinella minor TaxID=1195481 RepID=A0A8H7RW00_9FUNG|nr:hypothetical protein INT45_005466 [Circinella minor]
MLSESFRPILNSLVHLSLLHHTHVIDLHGFLRICCPKKVTHFTFDTSGPSRQAMVMDRDYSITPPPPNETALPKLPFTYLSLHATLYRYEIDHVLEQCPQLKCLLFDSVKPYGHTMMHVIDACAKLCPSLQCLGWGRIRPDFVSHWKTKASAVTTISSNYYQQEQKGLQEIVCGSFYHGGNSFSEMILSHHRTLEIIRLERLQNEPIDPWYPMTTTMNQFNNNNSNKDAVTFEKLRIIHMNNIHVNAESMAKWVYSCCNLEELSLHAITSDSQFWLERVFQALSSSKAKLKQLNITHDKRSTQLHQQENNNEDNNSINTSPEQDGVFGNDSIYYYNDDENPIYVYLIQSRKHQLKSIELGGKGLITDGILEALTAKSNASTLKHIALQYSAIENKGAMTQEGLHAFAHNLHWVLDELYITEKHQQGDNDDSDSLLTDDILILLSTKVKRLILQGCKKITGKGLETFLQRNSTVHDNNGENNCNHNHLEYLEIVECGAKIDKNTNGIEYARTVLGTDNVRHIPSNQQNESNTTNTVYFAYM